MMFKVGLILLFAIQCKLVFTDPLKLLEDPLHAHDQLPRTVKIIGYELTIEPFFPFPGLKDYDRQDLTFEGTVKISFQVIQDTPGIWLNYENLNIQSVLLKRHNYIEPDNTEVLNAFQYYPDKAQVLVEITDWFKEGDNHTLEIKYNGPLYNTTDGGFFYYTYNFNDTVKKTVVATVFEPAMARRMFPCFDDPYFKAWYRLNLIYPNGAKYFHTTMEEGDEKVYSENKKIVGFQRTKPMSSYLFSVAVGDFDFSSARTSRGIPIRSIVFSELKDYSARTAQIGADCVDAFEALVGYDFPLDKLDNIDTHDFFHGGGIENWGLILFTDVLAQHWPSLSAVDEIEIKSIICHETSHQWMGDLVTTKHWGNEFLHESFASYFEFRLIQYSIIDKDFLESDLLTNRFYGFVSTISDKHPIATNESNFDGVTYSTGTSVLRMLEGVTGQDNFYKIVKKFLGKFAFGNADMYDLINVISDHFNNINLCGDLTYREFLLDFLTQSYYPIVDIGIWGGQISFKQQSFNSSLPTKWNIPLFVGDGNKQQIYWLLKNGSLCYASDVKEPKTGLIYNYKGFSFAQFRYSSVYWQDLLDLDYSKIDEHTILGLLTDLTLDSGLKTPTGGNIVLTRLINKLFTDFNNLLSPQILTQARRALGKSNSLRKTILDTTYPHINWNATELREGALAEMFLTDAVKANTSGALTKATTLFRQFMTDCAALDNIETCNKLNPNIRRAVYCAGSTDPTMNSFLNSYITRLESLVEPYFYLGQELYTAIEGEQCLKSETLHGKNLKRKRIGRNFK